jgi:predicted flap endonuclease-1-like 5' DNA nuclease
MSGGPKKFSFGFPSKKVTKPEEVKRKVMETPTEEPKKKQRSLNFVADDEDDLLAIAGIGKVITNPTI